LEFALAHAVLANADGDSLWRYDFVRGAGAVRAAGLPIIVPCHRVIGANGSLTGFGGGIERKCALLDLEARASRRQGDMVTRWVADRMTAEALRRSPITNPLYSLPPLALGQKFQIGPQLDLDQPHKIRVDPAAHEPPASIPPATGK